MVPTTPCLARSKALPLDVFAGLAGFALIERRAALLGRWDGGHQGLIDLADRLGDRGLEHIGTFLEIPGSSGGAVEVAAGRGVHQPIAISPGVTLIR